VFSTPAVVMFDYCPEYLYVEVLCPLEVHKLETDVIY
jgi:hypothetical protein